jgi:hypothetical protein
MGFTSGKGFDRHHILFDLPRKVKSRSVQTVFLSLPRKAGTLKNAGIIRKNVRNDE